MYYLRYSLENNNLLSISNTPLNQIDGTVVETRNEDIPDLTLSEWNPSILDFSPLSKIVISRVEFLKRLSIIERVSIREAAKTDPFVEDLLNLLNTAEFISLEDKELQAGLGYLVYKGLITQLRADEISA